MTPVEPLDGSLFNDNSCFGCSPGHPFGFHLKYEREGEGVLTHFMPTAQHQGPLGIMHGGLVSTLADETAAWAIIAKLGKFGFTTSFGCRLLRPVRINVATEARGWLTRETSRIVKVGVAVSQGGLECYTGDFTFVLLDAAGAEKMLGTPLPESWRRFARE
jgi:acyl-coenzyme A thioesterase PaaI-like protein